MKILQCNPGQSYARNKEGLNQKIQSILEGGWYILGQEVGNFETAFAQYCTAGYGIGCANGTDAIELVLRGLGIKGSYVATVANTAVATVAGIECSGNTACFADIDPETFTISPDSLERLFAVNPDIKAVIAVHLFGQPADMDRIMAVAGKYGAVVIEDCAQAHGAMYKGRRCGSMGIAGCFSFYPTKNLGCYGDGGAVVTSDPELAERFKALRQYGWTKRFLSEYPGINSRLDELQAGILSFKLPYLDADNQRRKQIADRYMVGLRDISALKLPGALPDCGHVYHQYVLRCSCRDKLRAFLAEKEIGTAIHYPVPIHRQEAYSARKLWVNLPETEKVNNEILSLPMYPELTDEEVDHVISSIQEFFT